MELRDRSSIRPPVLPGQLRDYYRATSLTNVPLFPPPWHLPRKHFEPQDFPDVELRRSLASCNIEDENAGFGLFLLSDVMKGGIISWYSKDIISLKEADRLKARAVEAVADQGHRLHQKKESPPHARLPPRNRSSARQPCPLSRQ